MSDLLPCPFCGGEAQVNGGDNGRIFVECNVCAASSMCAIAVKDDPRPMLVSAWNRRSGNAGTRTPAPAPMVELADTSDSKSDAFGREGSSPSRGTRRFNAEEREALEAARHYATLKAAKWTVEMLTKMLQEGTGG